ncbi:MAG: hypothetical protein J0I69_11665 [Altererythrobacter sp.]|nr:hypothetical protein [Altererythrobacter sp.]OJU59434.1 MAG: hypothetical protein BGO08_03665 [Altererythrobacter sp. 66-12]
MGANAHRTLFSSGEHDTYLRGLTVDAKQRAALQAAREEIRDEIRSGLRAWSDHVDRTQFFEVTALASVSFADSDLALRPKFRMQGSWSYHTLNRATHNPPQEIDLDDGVFLPVSFLSQNGGAHPIVASAGYFTAVERILAPLCDRNGWTLITNKPSCVRVEINDDAHVDLALYAIPDDEFEELLEKAAASLQFDTRMLDENVSFAEQIYPRLPTDQIMLAHREEGWKPSDPRKLEDWFQDAINAHGQQLRRVCRYLKGWRDHNWTGCRLSSIALMACVVAAYDEAAALIAENRDDLALQMVAKRLPELLERRIPNPVVHGQYLDEGWAYECRADFIAKARCLVTRIDAALAANQSGTVIEHLRAALGDYLPDDEDLVVIEAPIGAPTILQSGILKDFADQPDAREAVKKGGDGRYG